VRGVFGLLIFPHLPLPVQPMGVGDWLSPCIICNVYPDTCMASREDKTRRGSPFSWPEGVYNQVIEPEPEPPGMGVLMAPEVLAPRNQSLCRLTLPCPPPPPLLLPPSSPCLVLITSGIGVLVGLPDWPTFNLSYKCSLGSCHGALLSKESGCGPFGSPRRS
jgi:hypothetical protein